MNSLFYKSFNISIQVIKMFYFKYICHYCNYYFLLCTAVRYRFARYSSSKSVLEEIAFSDKAAYFTAYFNESYYVWCVM